jgi:plasmid stabilization system protein ParE
LHRKAEVLAEILEMRDGPCGARAALEWYEDLRDELEPLVVVAEMVQRLRPERPDVAWRLRTRRWLVERLYTSLAALAGAVGIGPARPGAGAAAARCA